MLFTSCTNFSGVLNAQYHHPNHSNHSLNAMVLLDGKSLIPRAGDTAVEYASISVAGIGNALVLNLDIKALELP